MTAPVPNVLPCGRPLAALMAQVADGSSMGPGRHHGCVHCSRASAALERVWLRLEIIAADEIPPPSSLEIAVRRRIRRERFVCGAIQAVGAVLSRVSRAVVRYAT